ncbi:hypothetical protein ACB098_03G074900 [Castanea mollissima]
MALFRTRSSLHQPQKIHSLLLNQLFIFFLFFQSNESNLTFQGDAYAAPEGLQITKNTRTRLVNSSVGRVSFHNQVCLWDNSTGRLTDFVTHFSFIIQVINGTGTITNQKNMLSGDGLSFFIAPFESNIPNNSAGGYLGLFSNEAALYDTQNKIVAVEFDTYKNSDFTDQSDNHVGIDVNSIVSKTYVSSSRSFNHNPVFSRYSSSLSYIVDLKAVLPEWVRVGFSAATGDLVESHTILSWSFSSNLEPNIVDGNHKKKPVLWIGLAVGLGVVSCALGLLWFIHWRKRTSQNTKDHLRDDVCMDDEFEKGTGPRSFTYRELIRATNNFTRGKLGEGGFGGVYKGLLSESNVDVAVKRVSEGSKQGRKEYISEVKIISRLRHRNLVQLIGWCHEHDELLLYMPNGSLDSHLYEAKTTLTWPGRYNVVQGLACALLYLHEEWEQCIVHRDIKPSNIMLDTNFNAKVGDFGLARLVDHDLGSKTTVLASTMGYLAPECATSGKASKESDVYSFGMVSLEIVCGRKPIDPQTEPNKVNLVEWVWELYGKGQLLEAVDLKLNMEFDKEQIQCLMVVGLWCCHPDPGSRPSTRKVLSVLNFEAPLPNLPSKLPVSTFGSPMHKYKFSNTSSLMGSSTNLSTSDGPSKPLPWSGKVDVQLASIVN